MDDTGQPTRSLTMLNGSGDSSLTWTEESDSVMETLIAKKMAEGVTFFIVKPRVFGVIPAGRKKAESVEEAMKGRSLSVRDQDFAKVIADGVAQLAKRPEGGEFEGEIVRDPKVAVRRHTVGVGARAGG